MAKAEKTPTALQQLNRLPNELKELQRIQYDAITKIKGLDRYEMPDEIRLANVGSAARPLLAKLARIVALCDYQDIPDEPAAAPAATTEKTGE